MKLRLTLVSILLVCLSLIVFAQERPELLIQEGHSSAILDSAISEDGLEAFTASKDGTIKVWDIPEHRVKRTIFDASAVSDKRENKMPLETAVISSELGLAATKDNSGTIRVFRLTTGEMPVKFKPNTSGSLHALDQDSLYLVNRMSLTRYDWSGNKLATLEAKVEWDEDSLSISDGLLSLTDHDKLFFIDAETLRPVSEFSLQPLIQRRSQASMAGRLSPDGSKFALGTGYQLAVIDVKSGKLLFASESLDKFGLIPNSLPAGQFRPAAETNPTIFFPRWIDNEQAIWSRRSSAEGVDTILFRTKGESVETLDMGHLYYSPASVNSDGAMLVPLNQSGRMAVMSNDQQVGILEEASSGISDFSYSPEAGLLLFAGDGKIRTWDVRSGVLGRSYEDIEGLVFQLDVSPGGTRLLAQSRKSVVVWDLATGEVLSRYALPPETTYNSVEQVRFVDETLYLLLEDDQGVAKLIEAATGRERDTRRLGGKSNEMATFNRSRTRVSTANRDKSVTEWSTLVERDRLTVPLPNFPTDMLYLADGKTLLIASHLLTNHAVVYRWEYDRTENRPESWIEFSSKPIIEMKENADRSLTLLISDGTLIDLSREGVETGRRHLKDVPIYGALRPTDDLLLVVEAAGTVAAYDPSTCELRGEFVLFDRGESWVAFTGDGRFDGSEQGMKNLDFELNGQLYSLSQFFNDYYTPGLLTQVFGTKRESEERTSRALTAQTLSKPPVVEITAPASGSTLTSADLQVEVSVVAQGSGVSNVSLFLNGHRIPDTAAQKIDETTYRFAVKAVKGQNDITASAFDRSGAVESRQDRIRVKAPDIEARPPKLHILSVGVDEYQSGMTLRFAEDDANSINQLFKTDLYQPGRRSLLSNEKAARIEILKAIDEIASEAEPQDALIVYLAGHGTVVGDVYYFLPSDTDVTSDQALATSAISSEQLAQKLSQVPATKQLLILDSCRSGAAAGAMSKYLAARSGLEEIRSQQMLARTSGVFLIAATKGEEYAYEIPELGHGVLTYAILNALGMSGQTETKATTANDLLRSVSGKVPELSEKYHGVRQQVIQWSSGQDFPLTR